jgi:hypothetical protein
MNDNKFQQIFALPKLLFIATALFIGTLSSIGQTSIAVAPTKMNVLYIGIDNPLSIAASGGADEKVTVSVSGGGESTVSKAATGMYNVRVSAVTDECLVNVYVEGKLAGTSTFRVRNLPRPVAMIGGYTSGSRLTPDILKQQSGIGVYLKDFPLELKYEVVGFKFMIGSSKGEVKAAECQGALFSSQVKQYLEEYAKPGNTITIENIWIKDQSGKELKLPALVYPIEL